MTESYVCNQCQCSHPVEYVCTEPKVNECCKRTLKDFNKWCLEIENHFSALENRTVNLEANPNYHLNERIMELESKVTGCKKHWMEKTDERLNAMECALRNWSLWCDRIIALERTTSPLPEKQSECKHEWIHHSESTGPMSMCSFFICSKCGRYTRNNPVINSDPIRQCYEKYKHLDNLFSDKAWLSGPEEEGYMIRNSLYDLWQAIKAHCEQ